MEQPQPPLERLAFFRRELGITPEAMAVFEPYAEALAGRAQQMADNLFENMGKMAQTKIILDRQTSRQRLQSNWTGWYTTIWEHPCDDEILATLWHSGLRHVTHGVDHRFITLAYSQVRNYTHQVIHETTPASVRSQIHILADKLIDLCVLVESDAYIAAQAHCSNDVMMGIAHQLRNPLTIIGGMASRMMRVNASDEVLHSSMEAVLGEAGRLERMLEDLVSYLNILRAEPMFETFSLKAALDEALAMLEAKGMLEKEAVTIDLSPEHDMVQADPGMVREALYHLLQNAADAAGGQDGVSDAHIVVTSAASTPVQTAAVKGSDPLAHFVTIELCNLGAPPQGMDLEDLFQPFHSSKPYGTGLGLAIARLATKKNFGAVQLAKLPADQSACSDQLKGGGGEPGLRCLVTLVRPGHVHDSGLFFSDPESQH